MCVPDADHARIIIMARREHYFCCEQLTVQYTMSQN